MSKHTPGPWRAAWTNDVGPDDDEYYVEFYEILDAQGNRVGTAEEEADAALMAAGPDLLAALQTILNMSLMDKGHWARTIEQEAHAAILKATGGSHD